MLGRRRVFERGWKHENIKINILGHKIEGQGGEVAEKTGTKKAFGTTGEKQLVKGS